MTPTLADYGIGFNPIPPKDEPGKRYILVKECGHVEAVELAIQCRETHPNEPIEIWPKDGDLRLVVREVRD